MPASRASCILKPLDCAVRYISPERESGARGPRSMRRLGTYLAMVLLCSLQSFPQETSELDDALSTTPPTRASLSRPIDMFLSIVGLAKTPFAQAHRDTLLNAELAAQTRRTHLVLEEQLAGAFTQVMRTVGAPQWAQASGADIHDLRLAVRVTMPHLVQDQAAAFPEPMTPLEALYIFHVLSLNGGLVRDQKQGMSNRVKTRKVLLSQSAVVTDPLRLEFIAFRTRLLENSSPELLSKIGRSLFELLHILD
jgi:hypothetical protein